MRVIGITSGTSFDAIEALAVELQPDGGTLTASLLEHRSVPYPARLCDAIASVLPPASTTVEEVCKLDIAIGKAFAAAAGQLADAHGPIDVVCSHGQTVYHWVEGRTALGSLQLGAPAWIAERTGAAVVSDVRNRDIAAGGQGARSRACSTRSSSARTLHKGPARSTSAGSQTSPCSGRGPLRSPSTRGRRTL